MGYLIGVIVVFILSLNIAVVSKKKMEIVIPFVFSLIGILIYSSFSLQLGRYSVAIVAALAAVMTVALIVQRKYNSHVCRELITPGTCLWVVLCIVMCTLYKGWYTLGGDDHSVWAMAVKHMYYNDTFPCAQNSNVSFKYYIPGKPCVEYFFMKLNGVYNDEVLYRTLTTWLISLGLPLLKDVKWKEWGKLIFRAVMCIVFPFLFFNPAYSTINSDALLCMVAAYILVTIFLEERESKFFVIWLSIMLGSLTSLKSAGSSFAWFILFILAVDMLAYRKKKESIWNIARTLGVPILFTVIVSVIWRLMLEVYNYANITPYASSFTIEKLINIVFGNGTAQEYDIINKFVRAFINSHLTQGNGKPFVSNLIIVAAIAIMIFLCKEWLGRKRTVILSISISICTFFYMIGILWVYLFSFQGVEAINLASYKRYSSLWLGAVVIFLVTMIIVKKGYVIQYSSNLKKYIYLIFPTAFGIYVVCNLYIVFFVYNGYFVFNKESASDAYNNVKHVEEYKEFLTDEDKVYVVSQSGGYYFLYIKYLLTPILCSDEYLQENSEIRSWKLAAENDDQSYTIDEWSKILEDYTYVYIYEVNDEFINRYNGIFENEIKEKELYKVVNNVGKVRLVQYERR